MTWEEHPRHRVAEHHRRDHTEHRDQQRRGADLRHLAEIGCEADFEQQEQHADLGDDVERRVGDHGADRAEPDQAQIAEHDAHHQLAQHRRQTHALEQRATELGADQDHDEGEQQRQDVHAVLSLGGASDRRHDRRDHGEQQSEAETAGKAHGGCS